MSNRLHVRSAAQLLRPEFESVAQVEDLLVVAVVLDDGVVQVADEPIQIDLRQLDGRDVDVGREFLQLILDFRRAVPLLDQGAFVREKLDADRGALRHFRDTPRARRGSHAARRRRSSRFSRARSARS